MILTDPGPIKLHGPQEFLSLLCVIDIVSHSEQSGFSLDESFSELLPVRSERRTTFQHQNSLRNWKGKGNICLRSTKRQSQDKMSNVILPPLLIQFDGSCGIVAKRQVLRALISHNFP